MSEAVELAFYGLVVTTAQEAILCGLGVDETQAALQERWPRLDCETIEQAMVEALYDGVLTPQPLAPPGPGVDPADLHPSWRESAVNRW